MKATSIFMMVLLTLMVITGVIGYSAYRLFSAETVEQVEETARVPVHVTVVKRGSVEDVIPLTGKIRAEERVNVLAKIPMPGKLIRAHVKKGDRVRKNQVLLTVDRDETGAKYRPYPVKAPLSGLVASIEDDRGALVTAQQPVAVIIDIDRVKVKTSVIEADLGKIKKGIRARVMVDTFPDKVFVGTLTRIDPVLDELSHTANIEITLDNPDHLLLPGMFAKVELVADVKDEVPVIPKKVVFKRRGKNYCFLVKKTERDDGEQDLLLELKELELGYYDLQRHEVLEGVEEGDLLIDRDLVILKDKTKASLINPPEGWEEFSAARLSGDAEQEAGPAETPAN